LQPLVRPAARRRLATNDITVAALTDALILFAIGLVLARVARFARVLREPILSPRPHRLRG